jgi:hypothetical protein
MDRTKLRRICFHIKIYITLLALVLAGSSLGLVALRLSPDARAAADEIELPVLMYHAIMADPGRSGDYVITPEAFRRIWIISRAPAMRRWCGGHHRLCPGRDALAGKAHHDHL